MNLVSRLNKNAANEFNEKMKTPCDAKEIPADELSLHSDETCPPRKRRRTKENVPVNAGPADQTDGSGQVFEGGSMNGASMPIFLILFVIV